MEFTLRSPTDQEALLLNFNLDYYITKKLETTIADRSKLVDSLFRNAKHIYSSLLEMKDENRYKLDIVKGIKRLNWPIALHTICMLGAFSHFYGTDADLIEFDKFNEVMLYKYLSYSIWMDAVYDISRRKDFIEAFSIACEVKDPFNLPELSS